MSKLIYAEIESFSQEEIKALFSWICEFIYLDSEINVRRKELKMKDKRWENIMKKRVSPHDIINLLMKKGANITLKVSYPKSEFTRWEYQAIKRKMKEEVTGEKPFVEESVKEIEKQVDELSDEYIDLKAKAVMEVIEKRIPETEVDPEDIVKPPDFLL